MSRTTMRRRVAAAGGYFNRRLGKWVLPGAGANCTPWSVPTEWFATLEDAAEAAPEHAAKRAAVYEFADAEALYQRGYIRAFGPSVAP